MRDSLVLALVFVAGVVQLFIVAANFFAPRMLGYRESLAGAAPLVRQVFTVHALFIVLVLAAFASACFLFTPELAGASRLGRALSTFLAAFWGLRFVLQLAYYDRNVRRHHRAFDALFVTAFATLAAAFSLAALFPIGG